MASHSVELPPEQLRAYCDPSQFAFETTETAAPIEGTVGQDRALDALDFGLHVTTRGYNLFVTGVPGSGRSTAVLSIVERFARDRPPPDDWCYVQNFADPYRPRVLRLPGAMGPSLASDVDAFLGRCRIEIPRVFDSDTYQQRRQEIAAALDRKREEVYEELEREANEHGLTIRPGPAGALVIPIVEGRPISPEEFQTLPEATRAHLREQSEAFQQHLHLLEAQKDVREAEGAAAQQIEKLDRESVLFAVGHLLDELKQRYRDLPQVVAYLEAVQAEMVGNLDPFRLPTESAAAAAGRPPGPPPDDPFGRYRVNVLVTNSHEAGAPVVFEHNPTYYNLMGRIDYRPAFGSMSTDFRMIKAGAVHRANGGYLILQARDVLASPQAWDALKRALDTRHAAIENLSDNLSAVPTLTMRPEPVALDLKVLLIGVPYLQNVLFQTDEDFRKLFKVKADFDIEMARTPENQAVYAGFIRGRVDEDALPHFDRTGIAKVVEYGSRLMENQAKLSTRFLDIADLVSEAGYWADKSGARYVSGEHVLQAIAQKDQRSSLPRDKTYQAIQEGIINIASEGSAIGQVNGLSVLQTADFTFGMPSRITARVSPGSRGVMNVEREIEMSGRIHSKGVMILAGYLAGKYAQDAPLSLAASLTFEQLYNEVDGDSASSAELYCLLSALAGAPLDQGIAVTGSINQQGQVQAVGGVQYKIEGFYDVCRARGLTRRQGVVIPSANVQHLMVREDVVDAVRRGEFHVYAVSQVDQGIQLLAGLPAETIDARVHARLTEYANRMREYSERG